MSFSEDFQNYRRILCICPNCQDLVRLSDLRLKMPGSRKTWRDKYDLQERKVEEIELEFEEKEGEMRKEAIERGRRRVPSIVSSFFDRTFQKLKYDPYDINTDGHNYCISRRGILRA